MLKRPSVAILAGITIFLFAFGAALAVSYVQGTKTLPGTLDLQSTVVVSGDTLFKLCQDAEMTRPVTDIRWEAATFSEAMALAPTIAVTTDSTGDGGTGNLSATAMTDSGNRITWTHTYTVPAGQGNGGTAAVTISGTDLAGNPNTPATNNTFEIDNTRPTVALTYSLNRPVKGGENLTITATFSERMPQLPPSPSPLTPPATAATTTSPPPP